MDINLEIQKATDKVIAEKLPALVEEKVNIMLNEVLKDVFSSYSDSAKALKKKIEEQLNVNLEKYDLIDYSAMVAKVINDSLPGIINDNSISPIKSLIEKTVGYVKQKEISLEVIHEMVIEAAKEYHSDSNEGQISFHVIQNERYKWWTIAFDIDKDKDAKECSFECLVSDEGINKGELFSLKTKSFFSKKEHLTPFKVSQLSTLEHQIFRLYAARVKVKISDSDFDNENYWSRYDY